MNLHQIKYVKKIGETKSINKAAKALHISQPALSKQLKLLEEELKTTLFERSKNGCVLTKDGELFLKEAEIILNQMYALKQKFIEKSDQLVINIGALPSIASNFLPEIIQKLTMLGYKINIHVIDTSNQIKSLLTDRKIDVGFGQDLDESDYVYCILTEPYLVIAPKSSTLLESEPISLSELTNQTMILPAMGCDIRKSLDHFLNNQGLMMENALEVGQNDSILSLVRTGIGFTIMPEMAATNFDENLKVIPLKNKEFTRTISLLTYSNKLYQLFQRTFHEHSSPTPL